MTTRRWLKPVVFLACLVPLGLLLYKFKQEDLGPNPIEYITHATGEWTLRFIIFTLAITPLRRLAKPLNQLILYRRMLGLYAFFYGCLHFTIWFWLDKGFDLHEMWADVVKRRFITAGMVGLALMIPLAITSTKGWIRRLGRNWQRLHRLIYITAIAGVVHYYWLVKSDVREPLMYAAIVALLLGWRVWHAYSKQPAPVRPGRVATLPS